MQCPRLTHYVRLNSNGTVSRCGHMVNAPQFDTLESLESSSWLSAVQGQMNKDLWPIECIRCQQTEEEHQTSIRQHSIRMDLMQTQSDYLQVGGVLDNICNSACLSCNEHLSSRIADLKKIYPVVNNLKNFQNLPQERITHLDINGGEPSYSKNYQRLLKNLPPNLKSIRVNTNGSRVMTELQDLINRGIEVTITVSLDGTGAVHDLVRWPVLWADFSNNLLAYKKLSGINLNTWTTVSALNIADLPNIFKFVQENQIDHDYAFLSQPDAINVKYKNNFTLKAKNILPANIADQVAVDRNNQSDIDQFIRTQFDLRNI